MLPSYGPSLYFDFDQMDIHWSETKEWILR